MDSHNSQPKKMDSPNSQSESTLSSPSLQSLELRLVSHDNVVVITLDMPMLSQLLLDCTVLESHLELNVQTPNLQEISLIHRSEKARTPCIQCKQTVWKDNVFLKKIKWNKDLTYLDLQSAGTDVSFGFEDICQYATVEVLILSDFTVTPYKFLEMLYRLPLLESLTLSSCSFQDDCLDTLKNPDVDLELFDKNTTDVIVYTKRLDREIRLTDISISLSSDQLTRSPEAREILLLFWENAPYLKKITVTIPLKEHVNEAKCFQFFSHLLCCGDTVNLTKSDTSIVFQLMKKNPKQLQSFQL